MQNGSSKPGATSCGCNGQSSRQVTVTARVTNTGKVAGWTSLSCTWVTRRGGGAAAAAEGVRKVTLQPGQSTTVRFTLNGHDLSYWDDAADGWVLPDGKFSVYVGDSSALANLPLRGGFTVTRSIGARYATLRAASAMGAGSMGTPSPRPW